MEDWLIGSSDCWRRWSQFQQALQVSCAAPVRPARASPGRKNQSGIILWGPPAHLASIRDHGHFCHV